MNDLKQLVPIQEQKIGETFQKSVSARELYDFLQVKSRFATWIKNRIQKYGFVKDLDFSFSIFLEKPKSRNGGRPSNEYILTLDMAKELSMVENNEKGREARRYFIQCEKALRQVVENPFYTIQEFLNWKNVTLSDFEQDMLKTRCKYVSYQDRTQEKYIGDKNVFSLNLLQTTYQKLAAELAAKRNKRRNRNDIKQIESDRVLMELRQITQSIIEKQRLQNFIIHKDLMFEYLAFCDQM